jgi:hypothetical protein
MYSKEAWITRLRLETVRRHRHPGASQLPLLLPLTRRRLTQIGPASFAGGNKRRRTMGVRANLHPGAERDDLIVVPHNTVVTDRSLLVVKKSLARRTGGFGKATTWELRRPGKLSGAIAASSQVTRPDILTTALPRELSGATGASSQVTHPDDLTTLIQNASGHRHSVPVTKRLWIQRFATRHGEQRSRLGRCRRGGSAAGPVSWQDASLRAEKRREMHAPTRFPGFCLPALAATLLDDEEVVDVTFGHQQRHDRKRRIRGAVAR